MSPDFDELVGTDLEPDERERLERVHELLLEAGPPPELGERNVVPLAPRAGGVASCSRSRRRSPLPPSRSARPSSKALRGGASTSSW